MYNPSTDLWIQMANFGPGRRRQAVAMTIGYNGYAGLGTSNSPYFNDFWEYNPEIVTKTSIPAGDNFSVFPNPASNYFIIEGSMIEEIEISDVYGNLYFNRKNLSNSSSINIQEYANGIYLIKVKSKVGVMTKKLIVNRE